MTDTIIIVRSNGEREKVEVPAFGEIQFTVRKGTVAEMKTTTKTKYC